MTLPTAVVVYPLVRRCNCLPRVAPSRLPRLKHLLVGHAPKEVALSRSFATTTALGSNAHFSVQAQQSLLQRQSLRRHHQRNSNRTFFWSSKDDDQKETVTPVVQSQGGGSKFQPASFSLSEVISKQRDEDLSSHELALKMALQQHKELVDDPGSSNENIKKSLENVRNCFEALEYWEECFNVEQELESHAGTALELAGSIFRQGKLYMRVGDPIHASEKYRKALEMFQMEHGEIYHADVGNVLVAIAGVHYHRENPDECMQVLEEAEKHLRKHGLSLRDTSEPTQDPHPDLVKCLDNQGMIYRFREEFDNALEKFEEALALVGHSDSEKRQTLQMHIADMLSALDDVDAGIYYYKKILKEDKERRGSDEETELDAVIRHSIGLLHSQERQFELAEEELTRALELKKRFGGETNPDVASTLNALGSVHGIMGNKRQALECFQQALMIERMHAEDENEPQILHILRNISVLKGEKVPKWDG